MKGYYQCYKLYGVDETTYTALRDFCTDPENGETVRMVAEATDQQLAPWMALSVTQQVTYGQMCKASEMKRNGLGVISGSRGTFARHTGMFYSNLHELLESGRMGGLRDQRKGPERKAVVPRIPAQPRPRKSAKNRRGWDFYDISKDEYRSLRAYCEDPANTDTVKKVAGQVEGLICDYLADSVVHRYSFDRLDLCDAAIAHGHIPVSRTDFYGTRRLFYARLKQELTRK